MELCGRHYATGRAIRLRLVNGSIVGVVALDGNDSPGEKAAEWPWVAPGLLDIQVNGYGGQEFSSPGLTVEKAAAVIGAFEPFGVTRLCPTVTTERLEVMVHALGTIAALCESSPKMARRIPGIHLEGPYICSANGARGAHPQAHCRQPDWDEFQRLQEAARGRIRILTLAPELDGAMKFIGRAVQSGVVVAIGHTAASPEQVRAAADAGVRLSTHLGNGSHPMLHRLRNYVWAQLAEDRLTASLIVDGHHLPPEVVKVFVRSKGAQRCILVSDISGQAGQPPGRYKSPFCDVEILPSGRLVVAGQTETLAGASLALDSGVANAMRFAGIDLETAIRMAVHHPASLLGIQPGGLEVGDPADLVQFHLTDPDGQGQPSGFQAICTVIGGEAAWGRPWSGLFTDVERG